METIWTTDDGAVILRRQKSDDAPAIIIVKDLEDSSTMYGFSRDQAYALAMALLGLIAP